MGLRKMNYKSTCKVKSKNVSAPRFFARPADGTGRQAGGDRKVSAMGRTAVGRTAWMSHGVVRSGLRERGS